MKSEKRKQWEAEYRRKPENIERKRVWASEYYKIPEIKEAYLNKWKDSNKLHKDMWINFINSIGYNVCCICGYDKCFNAIDFHHINPGKKEANIGSIISRRFSPEMIKLFLDETDKCVVVCANCHREIHSK